MLQNGTGVQGDYNANLPFTMVGVPNGPHTPTTIKSMQIDPSQGGIDFIPGETWVSRTDKGTIIRGIAPNSNLLGVVMRGASREAGPGEVPIVYNYEQKGPVPVGTVVTTWINVVTAPGGLESYGVAINNETGKATCYDNSATAGFFTCGEQGATLADWQAIIDGSFGINVNGGGVTAITGLDFSAATSFQDVAAIIEAGLTGAYCTYNQAENLFVFTSASEGATSSIALSADATGTSIYVADYLNGAGGAATAGTDAGSPPTGYTAAPGVAINRWSAQDPTKVEVSLPKVSLE